MNAPAPEIPTCRCGERMVPHNKRGDLFRCANCDGLQPGELATPPKKRVKTQSDHRFELAWKKRARTELPNSDPKGGPS